MGSGRELGMHSIDFANQRPYIINTVVFGAMMSLEDDVYNYARLDLN